jgi:hypothetical protein
MVFNLVDRLCLRDEAFDCISLIDQPGKPLSRTISIKTINIGRRFFSAFNPNFRNVSFSRSPGVSCKTETQAQNKEYYVQIVCMVIFTCLAMHSCSSSNISVLCKQTQEEATKTLSRQISCNIYRINKKESHFPNAICTLWRFGWTIAQSYWQVVPWTVQQEQRYPYSATMF